MRSGQPCSSALWDANLITVATCGALALPVAASLPVRGMELIGPMLLALGLSVAWSLLFARMRRRPVAWDGIVTALVFALLIPGSVSLWQQGLALSFGLVMGDLVFGGRGRGFLNPAVVGLAFLMFSFPGISSAQAGQAVAIGAVAIGAGVSGAVLLFVGLLSWRVVLGFALGVAALIVAVPVPPDWIALHSATVMLGLVFLIGDPVAAACTNAGRWIYGGLAGGLMVLLGQSGGIGGLDTVVFAALLASIAAPLIDQIVIAANVARRARRQALG